MNAGQVCDRIKLGTTLVPEDRQNLVQEDVGPFSWMMWFVISSWGPGVV